MERYIRQIVLDEIEKKGQEKLGKKSVAVIGLGGLGGITSSVLARIGIGKITLIDRDFIELSNLQRQFIFDENDMDRAKARVTEEKLNEINSSIEIDSWIEDFNSSNGGKLVKNVDLILDGTDNLETRFLINDLSLKNKIPWIYTSAIQTRGMCFNIVPGETPCFRCLIEKIPPTGSLETCETAGILSSVLLTVTSYQITQCLKILLNREYSKKLFSVDIWRDKFEFLNVGKKKDCKACQGKYEFLEGDKTTKLHKLCGKDEYQIKLPQPAENFEKLGERLRKIGKASLNKHILHFQTNSKKLTLFKNGRAIVKGVGNKKEAKNFCSKYIG